MFESARVDFPFFHRNAMNDIDRRIFDQCVDTTLIPPCDEAIKDVQSDGLPREMCTIRQNYFPSKVFIFV